MPSHTISTFEELKIGGKAIKINASDRYGQYFRKAENLSIRAGSDRDKVEALFGGDLVKNSPVVVKVELRLLRMTYSMNSSRL